MKPTIDYKLLWVVDKGSNPTDCKLRMRVRWDHSRCIVSLSPGYNVNSEKWIQEAQRCKANTSHTKDNIPAVVINKRLADYEEAVEYVFNKFASEGFIPTPDEFKNEFNKAVGKYKVSSRGELIDRFDEFVGSIGIQNNWAASTYRMFNSLRNLFISLSSTINKPDDLNDKNMLIIQKEMIRKGHKNTSIRKTIKNIKDFIRWMVRMGYYNGSSHETFSIKLKGIESNVVVYLTWDELLKLYYMEFDDKSDAEARDVFCFCCFTSLRYSDVLKLQKCDVYEDRIEVVTEKTTDALSIDLNDYSRAILEKYKDSKFRGGKALPVPVNQVFNRKLKKICKDAGFTTPIKKVYYIGNDRKEDVCPKYKFITSHCGRRTFIVNALFLGIPAEVVMKWTGHSDYKAMRPYVEIVDELKAKEMNKFNIGPSSRDSR